MAYEIGRRDLIKLTAGATIVSNSRAAGQPKFFTAAEYVLVDELTEAIIPADERSGGAKAARVAEYIDSRLAEAFEQNERDSWRAGLARLDALSNEMHGSGFLKCAPAQRVAVLTRMSANEQNPKAPEELFFRELKSVHRARLLHVEGRNSRRDGLSRQHVPAGRLRRRITRVTCGAGDPARATESLTSSQTAHRHPEPDRDHDSSHSSSGMWTD